MASPPKPSLAPSPARLTPAAAKAKTNMPAGKQLTRFSDPVCGVVIEAENQGTRWVRRLSVHLWDPLPLHARRGASVSVFLTITSLAPGTNPGLNG